MSCFDLASRLEGNGSDDNHMVKSSKCSSNKGPNPKHPLKMAKKPNCQRKMIEPSLDCDWYKVCRNSRGRPRNGLCCR